MNDEVWKKNSFTISTNKADLDIPLIHKFLSQSYWAKGRTLEQVKGSIENAYCFGVYEGNKQIGFARVITDFFTFAYLADVFIVPDYQRNNLGLWLVEVILSDPILSNVSNWWLITKDAQTLYKKFGFEVFHYPERVMLKK